MKLSVVIACYDGGATLAGQLDALASQSWSQPWEVIISDNGSTDASLEIAEAFREKIPHLRIVDSSGGRGIAYARNVGAFAANGRSIAFCDQDDEVSAGWLAAMGEALERYELVAGRLDYERLNEPWAHAYRGNRQTEGLGYFWHGREDFLPSGFGCTLGVRRALFIASGGLDESFVQGCDELDLCWRLQLAGTELHFVRDAVTHYRCRHSFGELFRQARSYGEADVLVYAKWRTLGLGSAHRLPRQLMKLAAPFVWLLPRAVRGKADLARLVWQAGFAAGRIRGSFANRVLLLYR